MPLEAGNNKLIKTTEVKSSEKGDEKTFSNEHVGRTHRNSTQLHESTWRDDVVNEFSGMAESIRDAQRLGLAESDYFPESKESFRVPDWEYFCWERIELRYLSLGWISAPVHSHRDTGQTTVAFACWGLSGQRISMLGFILISGLRISGLESSITILGWSA